MGPIKTNYDINDIYLQKYASIKKMEDLMIFVDKKNNEKMIRTASTVDHNQLLTLFANMLSLLNLKADVNAEELFNKISNSINKEDLTKTAISRIKTSERKDDIKIVSKSIKDSHYQIDVSKDVISKQGKKMFMVSCYARDAYLGRYLIKRNYFYTEERETSADSAYDEIITKMSAIKERYYNEVIDVSTISTQFKKVLDGVVSEIKSEEDSLSTNINR